MITLEPEVLNALCPMHLIVDDTGRITHIGPTLARVCEGHWTEGASFDDLFTVFARHGETTVLDMSRAACSRVRIGLRHGKAPQMRAQVLPLGPVGGFLINLSFGIHVKEAVQAFGLKSEDFSSVDTTFEMLFLIEANAVAMQAWSRIGERLQAARVSAELEARTDALTGLGNRRAMMAAEEAIGATGPVAVLLLDLDGFKKVNDEHGHAEGDRVLSDTAEILRDVMRAEDYLIRSGGDEFLAILPGVVDAAVLDTIAGRVLSRMGDERPEKAYLSASIGVAVRKEGETEDLASLIARADAALYASKAQGPGRATLTSHKHITALGATG
ncbi:MAG: GGDEF domain-containing protein [Pseudomonadota bacterium]